MTFLYEKQTRRFFIFLASFCLLQACLLGTWGILQAQIIRHILVKRELAAASYLLEEEVSPALVASAFSSTSVTAKGAELLEKTGHTQHTPSYLLLLLRQTSLPVILSLFGEGLFFGGVLITVTGAFLQKREQLYEKAEIIISQYASHRFQEHLPAGETGGIYQLFGSIEELALSLQAKIENEHRTKDFLKDMISNISHQLKTPLAALTMYTEIMAEEIQNRETLPKFLQKSSLSLERMEQLISSLLKMARLDTGSILFEKRPCFLQELAALALADLLERAEQEEKEIMVQGEPEEQLFCDRAWTAEALENLVKNALDHTASGGKILIAWARTPAMVSLTVEDNGCGIPPEDIHHIFKQFYRSRASIGRPGAGLGLSLAKSIIEDQGGNLTVESRPGEGSVFRISFLTEL